MVAYVTVRALSRDLSTAGQARDIGQALLAAGRNFGLAHLLIAAAHGPEGPLALMFSSEPAATFDELSRHHLVTQAEQTDMPFALAEAFRQSGMNVVEWARGLPDGFERFNGVVVPVHDDRRLAWWVCFAGEDPLVDRRTMCILATASYAAQARMTALAQRVGDKRVLTAREMECLRLAATGKSDHEVGQALGICGRTVRFHVSNAKEKLGARTRLQAVARVLDIA